MAKKANKRFAVVEVPKLLKLDLGCGIRPRDGFEGVDTLNFGQPHIVDLTRPWPWTDNSVEEATSSHFIEHLNAAQRIHFANELHRVLIPGGKCTITVPNWSADRAYGDLTHQWPPVSSFWFNYLNAEWRKVNAPHNDFYTCDFDHAGGYSILPEVAARNTEYQQHALRFWINAGQDLIVTVVKRAPA